jgi:hypothetical protein
MEPMSYALPKPYVSVDGAQSCKTGFATGDPHRAARAVPCGLNQEIPAEG